MIKGSIQLDDVTNINLYAPNIRAPKHVKQILIDAHGEIYSNIVIVKDINNPLSVINRSSRHKIIPNNFLANIVLCILIRQIV
jgi:hypothetical protein